MTPTPHWITFARHEFGCRSQIGVKQMSVPVQFGWRDGDEQTCNCGLAQAAREAQARETALRDLVEALYPLFGNPEDCDDCGDIEDHPCRIHGPESSALYHAAVAAEEVLGPCPCGHARSEHHDEDTTKCRVCACPAFKLPPLTTPALAPVLPSKAL